jgi:hypothetical protein
MEQLNRTMLNKAISRAVHEKEETCKDETLMSRARVRYQLEANEILRDIKASIEKKQATLTQIGYQAIKSYIKTFAEAFKNDEKPEEKTENTTENVKKD